MRIVVGQGEFDVRDARISVINTSNLKRIDWFMALIVMCLVVAGWLALYSATYLSEGGYFTRQVAAFFAGVAIAGVIIVIDYRFVVVFAPAMYVMALLMLVATLEFGSTQKGSERWLQIGPVGVQPSELTKLVMVYFLAWYLNALGERIKKFYWFVFTFILVGIPMLLILKQPNLGTAMCLGPLVMVMLFVAGCRFRHLALVVLAGLSLVPVVWWQMRDFDGVAYEKAKRAAAHGRAPSSEAAAVEAADEPEATGILRHLALKPYQKQRIYAFLHPEAVPDSGWQTYQSLITVGSGGLSGKGYMDGTQTKLKWLPEHRTDFIFSLVAEENGFIGASVVIGLFAAFLLRGLMFARDCPDMTGTLLAAGVVTVLGFHVFVNIAITIGLMPVTGIPLPFLSYGRSFYLTTMMCVGVLMNIPMRRKLFVN